MSRKFISQVINQNFVYPNNEVSEYDIDITQDLNDNSVSGTINSFSATTVNSTGITISMNYTWDLNAAEPFIRNSNVLSMVSVHAMGPTQLYYKPFRCVGQGTSSNVDTVTYTGLLTFTILPAQLALASFTSGTYQFEVRFIGHRAIYPVCQSLTITI